MWLQIHRRQSLTAAVLPVSELCQPTHQELCLCSFSFQEAWENSLLCQVRTPLQLIAVTKQLKRVMWYPTQTFGYLLFAFFTSSKTCFIHVHVCASVARRPTLPTHLHLLLFVGLSCIAWWVDPIQQRSTHTAAWSLSPSSSRTGERTGRPKVRKRIG